VLHRDLKPSNILVTSDGQPHVLDFGLAKALFREEDDLTISVEGDVAGTPAYMSPEQAAGKVHQVDTRSDVYCLGVILYQLLTGRFPHEMTGGKLQVLRRIAEEEILRPRTARPGLNRELEAILLKALASNPDDRYATAGELADDIGNFLSGDPLKAHRPTTAYFLRKRIRKHWGRVSVAALLLVLLVSGAIYSYFRIAHEKGLAEASAAGEREARIQAEAQRARADQSAQEAAREAQANRRALYANRIATGFEEYRRANATRVRELLQACPKDLRSWEWHYLWRLTDQSQQVLSGHQAPVVAVSATPDGTRIASGDANGFVKTWDGRSGGELTSFRAHDLRLFALAISPDGREILTAGPGSALRLWDAATGAAKLSIPAPKGGVRSVVYSPDGRWIASGADRAMFISTSATAPRRVDKGPVTSDRYDDTGRPQPIPAGRLDTLKVWDVDTGREIHTLAGHCSTVGAVAFDAEGKRIVSGSENGELKVWDARTGKEDLSIDTDGFGICSVAFSSDGNWIFAGSRSGTLKIWHARTGRPGGTLKNVITSAFGKDYEGPVLSVGFSPDLKHVVWSCFGNELKVQGESTKGQTAVVPTAQTGMERPVAISPDNQRVIWGGLKGEIGIWNLTTRKEERVLSAHGQQVSCLAFSADGRRFASASHDGSVKVWQTLTGQCESSYSGHGAGHLWSVAISADGRRVASAADDGAVNVWDQDKGKEPLTLRADTLRPRSVAFSADGKRIVAGGEYNLSPADDLVRVYDAATGKLRLDLRGHSGGVQCVCFDPDSRRLASCDDHGLVRVWNVETGQELLAFRGCEGGFQTCTRVAFSPDGKGIFAIGLEGKGKLWDAATGLEKLSLPDLGSPPAAAAFSPDGKSILTAVGQNLKLWDSTTGREQRTLQGHLGDVTSAVFVRDGTLISGGADRSVRVWRGQGPAESLTFGGHDMIVWCVTFSPDGNSLASGGYDRTVRVCDAATGREKLTLGGHSNIVTSVAYSPDGRRIYSGSGDQTPKVWDADTGRDLTPTGSFRLPIAFSPDGRWFLSIPKEGTVEVCDARSQSVQCTVPGRTPIAFSPDGGRLLTSMVKAGDNALKVWDVATGREALQIKLEYAPRSAAFSPDGKLILSGGYDGTVALWNAKTGATVLSFRRGDRPIPSVAFSSDGRRIIFAGLEGPVSVCDAADGSELLTLSGPKVSPFCLALSPDGRRIAVGNGFGTLTVWDSGPWDAQSE
jgi:WD40 repeat protein